MPKVSKDTASTHTGFPGYVDAYEQEIGDWTVTIESNFIDMDQAPFFKGAPNDQCQANHFGYVLKGKFGVRWMRVCGLHPPPRRRRRKAR